MTAPGPDLAPLRGDIDIAKAVRLVPPGHTIKGAFLAPNAKALGSDWPRIAPTLLAPPRGGKYLAFSDYPLADHMLLEDHAARRLFPGKPTCEAHRLLARGTMDTFTETTLGRVALALVSDPKTVFFKYGEVFNRMLSGPRTEVRSTGASSVEVEYWAYYSFREAIYGVLEGIVLVCGRTPRVVVEARGDWHYVAYVEWHLD
jgi:uncharacterized protein (TIGR02265 family)